MTDMTIGQRIGQERKKLGLSQELLGEKMGVSRQAISKWESDSAVPEIDKLIAMSKLFGVTVGWLLGVEEAPAPTEETQSDILSDAQLYLVEELVKEYQPKPKKLTYPWALLICLILLLTTYIYRLQSNINTMDHAYDSLYTQFVELRTRMQKLEDIQTNPNSLSLFGDYSFEILQVAAGESDIPEAEIRFRAMPNIWKDGDTAHLTITREGVESARIDCTWNGAWLFATVPLEVADGYDFCMTIVHADGTQEQQVVTNAEVENLEQTLSVTAEVTPGTAEYANQNLVLSNYVMKVSMPSGAFYGSMLWKTVDLVLTSGGEELGRFNLLLAEKEVNEDVLRSPTVAMEYLMITFENIYLPKNEGIQLWICAETNNGLSTTQLADAWVRDADGTLRNQ